MPDDKKIKKREEIEDRFKWNLNEMYEDEALWDNEFRLVKEKAAAFSKYAGRLAESADILYEAFCKKDEILRILENVYVYARMKKDEDNRADKYQAMSEKAQSLAAETGVHLSFFTPEVIAIPEEKLFRFMEESSGLKLYEYVIRDLIRQKKHILSGIEENLIAQFREIASAPGSIFKMINNADIKFGCITDEDGDDVEVTHGKYIMFLESNDRRVRKDAFETLYAAYEKQKNTLASTYNYNVKTDAVYAKIRKYESSLEAALSSENIPTEVYTNLIDIVNQRLDILHRYVDVRKKMLKLDEVHMYDMYAPLVEMPKKKIEYEEAVEIVKNGLKPMGNEYIEILSSGFSSGWVDVYENEGKTSGAYSFGSYDSPPYVLLNYNNSLKDVFTIAHEMGHSMHSYYTRKNQPYIYGGHSIFTAEVASTVNESLLMNYLLENSEDDAEKLYLLNFYIEEFRATFFRQTMFAEFEKLTHEAVESGEVLTSEWLCSEYLKLNKKYFGGKVAYDSQIAMEWSRIPHFYNAFYVYKYATGFSAAIALSNKILREGDKARENYINFLKSGDSDYPINLLQKAGVDMKEKEPIVNAIDVFEKLVEQIEKFV